MNAWLLRLIWRSLHGTSGSILVTSVSHGVWNGLAYAFFGTGINAGALGIVQTSVFGPETGMLGLVIEMIAAFVLSRREKQSAALEYASPLFAGQT